MLLKIHTKFWLKINSTSKYQKTVKYKYIKITQNIIIVDTPRSSPIINTSNIALVSGGEAVLSCSIDSIGNPAISWSWKCGTQSMYTRVQKRGRTTEVVIPAEQRLDGLSCYCTAQASGFQASSKPALVSVRCELQKYYIKRNHFRCSAMHFSSNLEKWNLISIKLIIWGLEVFLCFGLWMSM